jgi:peptidoglycan hydrolase-like protein with peptidoglycan-binding domain
MKKVRVVLALVFFAAFPVVASASSVHHFTSCGEWTLSNASCSNATISIPGGSSASLNRAAFSFTSGVTYYLSFTTVAVNPGSLIFDVIGNLGSTVSIPYNATTDSTTVVSQHFTAPNATGGQIRIRASSTGFAGTISGICISDTAGNCEVPAPTIVGLSPSSGVFTGGTAVTITGTSLTNVSAVSFGGMPAASFTVDSDTSITAVAPATSTPGTVDITVTSFAGTNTSGAADQFTYTKAPQNIAFDTQSGMTYGDADRSVSATTDSGLPASFVSATPVVCSVSSDGTVLHVRTAGTCTITAQQAGNAAYDAASDVSQSFTIAQKELTISGLSAADKTYDGTTNVVLVGTAALSGIVASDDVALAGVGVGTFVAKHAGSEAVLVSGFSITGASSTNYTLVEPSNLSASIARAALTLAAQPNTKTYDGTVAAAALPSVVGLAAGDTVTNLVEMYDTPSVGGGKTLTVSSYAINDGNSGGDYSLSTVATTTGSITQASQIISFAALTDKTLGDADFAVSATSTSGLIPSFTASAACTISTTTVHLLGVGSCTLTASQTGNSDYNSALDVSQTFSVIAPPTSGGGGASNSIGLLNAIVPQTPGGLQQTAPSSANASVADAGQGGEVLGAQSYRFTRNLVRGSSGDAVTNLQKLLVAKKLLAANLVTGYFGALTQKAVMAYQKLNTIIQTGNVGPQTRAALNKETVSF